MEAEAELTKLDGRTARTTYLFVLMTAIEAGEKM